MRNPKYIIFLLIIAFLVFMPLKCPLFSDTKGRKIETVIIDAGHGGKDPGAIGISGVNEKNIVLPICLKVRDYLAKEYTDMNLILTRDTDEFIELKIRGQRANSEGGNLFISIHANAKKNEENDKSGFEIYLPALERLDESAAIMMKENINLGLQDKGDSISPGGEKVMISLAQNSYLRSADRFSGIIERELVKTSKLQSRGVMQAGFWVLVGASMPCVLVETGYLSNKTDEEYLKSEKGQDEIAKAIYKSIRYFKMDYDFENGKSY